MKKALKRIYKKVLSTVFLIIFTILLTVPAIYTNSLFGYLPILVEASLLLLSGIYLMIMKKSLSVDGEAKCVEVIRGQKVQVSLAIKNNSLFVCSRAKANIFITDYFGNDDSTTQAVFTLDSRSTADLDFDVVMPHVGVYTTGIRDICVYGLLGIFSIKIPVHNELSVTVLPKDNEREISLSDDLLTDSPDASSFAENDGFDYTGVREYVPGDSMKKIHWKLSAHSLGYMTKLNETGLRSDVGVILDMVADNDMKDEELLYLNDGIIETGLSLINIARKKDIDNKLVFVDDNLQVSLMEPRSEYDCSELIRNISKITSSPEKEMKDAEALVVEEMQSVNRCANIVVCTSRITDGLLQALITVKNQQRNPMLFFIVQPDVSSQEKKALASKVKMLDEFGIYYEVLNVKV